MRADEFHQQEQEHQLLAVDAAYHTWLDERDTELDMKTSQMIQSKFLKKEDFTQPEVLTIKSVSIEEVGRGDTRWVIYFNEKSKGIVLNATKIKQLEAGFGDDTDYWLGKRIKVSHDPTVMMGQQVVGGIKFALPANTVKPEPKPEPQAADFNDDIPF